MGAALSALFSASSFCLVCASRVLLFRRSSSFCLCPLVGAARFGLSLYSSCSCVLLLLMSWGGFSFAWVVMHAAVSVSFLLLRLAAKKA